MAKKRRSKKAKRNLRRKKIVLLVIFVVAALDCWLYYPYYIDSKDVNSPDLLYAADNSRSSENSGAEKVSSGESVVSDTSDESYTYNDYVIDFSFLELPYFDSDEFIIFNEPGRYTLHYDTLYRQASWVAYLLTREDIMTNDSKRKNRFIPDPEVVDRGYPTAHTKHYTNSGYDRGHLCPSADRNNNQQENDCTFHLSNISPQTPALNRGVWKNLEDRVREWAVSYDSLYVVTGGVLEPGLATISGGVGIPNYFYKTILTRHEGEFHAIAFIIPNNEKFDCGYREYAVCVDSLQRLTAINFYHNLPPEIETVVENGFSDKFWFTN